MEKEQIEIGKQYQCWSFLLEETFTGDVIVINENTCIVELKNCPEHIVTRAFEFNNRFVVRFAEMIAERIPA